MDGKTRQAFNAAIGAMLGHQPDSRWAVTNRDETAICFQPEMGGSRGKAEAEEWLENNLRRFPNGWVAQGGYHVVRLEEWPGYIAEGTSAPEEFITYSLVRMGKISTQVDDDGTIHVIGEGGMNGTGSTLANALAVAIGVERQ